MRPMIFLSSRIMSNVEFFPAFAEATEEERATTTDEDRRQTRARREARGERGGCNRRPRSRTVVVVGANDSEPRDFPANEWSRG